MHRSGLFIKIIPGIPDLFRSVCFFSCWIYIVSLSILFKPTWIKISTIVEVIPLTIYFYCSKLQFSFIVIVACLSSCVSPARMHIPAIIEIIPLAIYFLCSKLQLSFIVIVTLLFSGISPACMHRSGLFIKIIPGIPYFLCSIGFFSWCIYIKLFSTNSLPSTFAQPKCLRNPCCVCNSQFLQFTVATEEVVIITRIRKECMFHNNSWNA